MLNVVIKPYKYLPCTLEIFTVNDIKADVYDFGDIDFMSDGEYGCKFSKFIPNDNPTEITLEKYHISHEEYAEICNKLRTALYITGCGLCW